jgi:tetratricopeptide (TPR) repeat protein
VHFKVKKESTSEQKNERRWGFLRVYQRSSVRESNPLDANSFRQVLGKTMSIISGTSLIAAILCLLPDTILGQSTPDVRESVDRLIQNCRGAGQLSDAEKLLHKAINLDEQAHGVASGEVANDLDTLSDVLSEEKKYSEAEEAIRDVLAIYTALDGPERGTNVIYLGRLANLAAHEQRFAEAEELYQEILVLEKSDSGFEHPTTLQGLAEVYHLAKDYPNCEALYLRVIESKSEQADEYYRLALEHFDGLSPDAGLMDHNLAIVMNNYAETLRKESRTDEAKQYENRAKLIEEALQSERPVCGSGNSDGSAQ